MIAIAKEKQTHQAADIFDDRFLSMLPTIKNQARVAFRRLPAEQCEELTAEVVANAFCAFVRLVEAGKVDLAYPTPLGRYAIQQVRAGRRVGTKLNIKDVSSPYAQLARKIRVERLDRRESKTSDWREIVVEDHRAGPAEIAATRIDFSEWLKSLPEKSRRIAVKLASGETTKGAARCCGLTQGRISQIRRELMDSWESFHGPRIALCDL